MIKLARLTTCSAFALGVLLAPAANAIDFDNVTIGESTAEDYPIGDLTGGTGHFGGLSIYDATRDGGSPTMTDTPHEYTELSKAAVSFVMALPGAVATLVGIVGGPFLTFAGVYFGPLISDELQKLHDDPLGPAYSVETAAQRDRRHAIADMVETMLGGTANNVQWDEKPYFPQDYSKSANGVTIKSANVRALGRRTRVGGTLSRAERALVSGWTPLQRKVVGLYLSTSTKNIIDVSGVTAKPLSTISAKGMENISKYLTPSTDQCTALGLVLYASSSNARGNMISYVAGTRVKDNSRRKKINDGFVKCMNTYRTQWEWATKLQ